MLRGEKHMFLESWEWGEFQAKYGRVFRFEDGDSFAQVFEKSIPFGFKFWFAAKGARGLSGEFLDSIKQKAKESGAIFLRFEPDSKPEKASQITAVNPSVTLITDLTQNEDALLAGMHSKTRYNIRLAQKKGVVVSESRDIKIWNDLMAETSKRDGFRAHPDEYYREMLDCGIVKLFVASYEGQPLAAMIATFFGDTATYLHGASSNEARDVMAPYALHFEVMKMAKSIGCARYDWWGLNPEDVNHSAYKKSWDGITRFKRGFGGREEQSPGTFEIALNSFWYRMYALRRRFLGRG